MLNDFIGEQKSGEGLFTKKTKLALSNYSISLTRKSIYSFSYYPGVKTEIKTTAERIDVHSYVEKVLNGTTTQRAMHSLNGNICK